MSGSLLSGLSSRVRGIGAIQNARCLQMAAAEKGAGRHNAGNAGMANKIKPTGSDSENEMIKKLERKYDESLAAYEKSYRENICKSISGALTKASQSLSNGTWWSLLWNPNGTKDTGDSHTTSGQDINFDKSGTTVELNGHIYTETEQIQMFMKNLSDFVDGFGSMAGMSGLAGSIGLSSNVQSIDDARKIIDGASKAFSGGLDVTA